MTDVFLSYSRKDRGRVEKLAAALEAGGYSVWWDKNLTGGGQFSKETEAQLNAAKAVVVVWSKTSISSMWVADEATVGRTKGNLLPVALDAIEPPIGFRQIQAIDFSRWGGLAGEAEFQSLNTTLAALLARAPAVIAPVPLWRKIAAKILKPQPLAAAAAFLALAVAVAALVVGNLETRGGKPVVGPKSAVAVLPFVNEGSARDAYLSEGFSSELRRQLGQVAGLQVIDDASSRAFRDTTFGAAEIAGRLGVGQLIEGALRRERGKLRIAVQIVDGATGFLTWSQIYERAALDEVAVQKEIAAAVAAALTGRAEAAAEVGAPASRDYSANDKMLLARHREQEVRDAQTVDEAKLGEAIDLYREAVAADPTSALLRSRLAGALLYAGDIDAAEPEINRAVELDPNVSEVQYTLGLYLHARRLPGRGAASERAVALNPNNADAVSGHADWTWNQKRVDEAGDLLRRALELDPMSIARYADLGNFYGVAGRRDAALALVDEIKARFRQDPRAWSAIAWICDLIGDSEIAVDAARTALDLAPNDGEIGAQLAEIYAHLGDFENAAKYEPEPGIGQLFWRREYAALIAVGDELLIDQPEQPQIWYLLAFAYSAVGEHENAARLLKASGLPENIEGIRAAAGAMSTLASALHESGERDEARAAAEWIVHDMTGNLRIGLDQGWWSNTNLACAYSILGRDDDAMKALAHVNDGPGLPWVPPLKDLACFKRFAADKRYTSVIAAVEKRQAELRAKVAAMDGLSSN